MLAAPFALADTHGILSQPGTRIRASSEGLGWKSLFVSEQEEAPFAASVAPVGDHLIVLHLGGPANVRGAIEQRDVAALVPPGGIFLWPAGSSFNVALEQPVETLHLYIRSGVVDEVAASLGHKPMGAAKLAPRLGERDELLEQLILEVSRAAANDPAPSAATYIDYLALAIAARLVQSEHCVEGDKRSFRARGLSMPQLRRVEDFIEANLDGAVHLDVLSSVSGLSVSHFVRQFKAAAGMPPHQFVMQRRVERAKRLLRHSREPIAQIALVCGFSHQEHFTRIFKRFTGDTPASFRSAYVKN
jgi:AraC family transcriptional regulator